MKYRDIWQKRSWGKGTLDPNPETQVGLKQKEPHRQESMWHLQKMTI